MLKRYLELFPPRDEKEKKKFEEKLASQKGYSATSKGIALINGGWEDFRGNVSREEVEKQFPELYEGITIREYTFRQNAGNIVHEVLHCLGLFHPRTFDPVIICTHVGIEKIPNIMSYYPSKFKYKHAVGGMIVPLQQKLIHSYIAGNNTYKAFCDSERDLDIFLMNIAEANNLDIRR